jgi:hypothetical protein
MDISVRPEKAALLNVENRAFAPALLEEVDVLLPKVPLAPLRAAHQPRG